MKKYETITLSNNTKIKVKRKQVWDSENNAFSCSGCFHAFARDYGLEDVCRGHKTCGTTTGCYTLKPVKPTKQVTTVRFCKDLSPDIIAIEYTMTAADYARLEVVSNEHGFVLFVDCLDDLDEYDILEDIRIYSIEYDVTDTSIDGITVKAIRDSLNKQRASDYKTHRCFMCSETLKVKGEGRIHCWNCGTPLNKKSKSKSFWTTVNSNCNEYSVFINYKDDGDGISIKSAFLLYDDRRARKIELPASHYQSVIDEISCF